MINKVKTPEKSAVYEYISDIDYSDAYSMKFNVDTMSAEEIYLYIFSSTPNWVMHMMELRNKIVTLFGLKIEEMGDIKSFKVGEKTGLFMIYSIGKEEIISGEDNIHLNFRLSVLKQNNEVFISTLVHYNNLFGKVYMTIITPFHKMIVKSMMRNALKRINDKC